MSTMNTITSKGYYLTVRQIATQQECSERHVKDLMREMIQLVGMRYAAEDFLEDSNMINIYALMDYLKYRRALKDPEVRKRVPEFDRQAWAEVCPIVERWRI